jgi:MFS family permease
MFGPLARLLPYALSFFSSLCIMVLELVASRLVARHVGASLSVWTSVIGIILGGICLGNVLGGRLADRVEPRRALGPLYALGSALTVACLWINALVGYLPGLGFLPWEFRTVIVVALDFLIPATVLGMISPVVAKIAVEEAKRPGSAIGDVYFLGAVGSIVGTFLAGFWLIYLAPTSTIVAIVAAALALLAALLAGRAVPALLGLGASAFLMMGALESIGGWLAAPGLTLGSVKVNAWALVGHALIFAMAVVSWRSIGGLPIPALPGRKGKGDEAELAQGGAVKLSDLATLAFVASLAFMAFEMVAGRLVTRHLGSSVYSWTSVIGVLLGGLSLGNYLGGKVADRIKDEKQASHLFLAASILVAFTLLAETPPSWLVRNPIGYLFRGEPPEPLAGDTGEFLSQAIGMSGYPWWFRVLFWTGVVFFLPSVSMGTVSPVVAKLAVDRVRRTGRTGSAIGQVYAWGMVGSLVGTFLTGFLLIDWLGTKGVILALATSMAIAATVLGSVWHAAWAGIPLGLCVIAFAPSLLPDGNVRQFLLKQGLAWGLREESADPYTTTEDVAYLDESNYYFIKVNNEQLEDGLKRTLVLDNLIHGYVILGNPRRLDYDYEHIYALVTHRLMQARREAAKSDAVDLGTLFLGGGSYTFPRYLQAVYPRTWAEVAEIDPAVTRANHAALGLPKPDRTFPTPTTDAKGQDVVTIQDERIVLGPHGSAQSREAYVQALGRIAPDYSRSLRPPNISAMGIAGGVSAGRFAPPAKGEEDEAVVVLDGETVPLGRFGSEESREAYIEKVRDWYEHSKYTIRTRWGDARQYVVRNQDKRFDVVYGDAFNDFSVPWHLTTLEFNQYLGNMLNPGGAYMINIIDVYESDENAAAAGPRLAMNKAVADAIRGNWRGTRVADDVAEALVDAMLPGEFEELLGKVSDAGAESLRAEHRTMTRGEILDAVRRSLGKSGLDKAKAPEMPSDGLTKAALATLMATRANELTDALSETRSNVIHRYTEKQLDEETASAILTALDRTRSVALADETEPKPEDEAKPEDKAEQAKVIDVSRRAKVIDDILGRLIEVSRTLAASDPKALADTINGIREATTKQFDQKTLTARQAKAVLDLLAEVTAFATQQAQGQQDAIDEALSNRAACVLAGRIAKDLAGVRSAMQGKAAEIEKASRSDSSLASAAVAALTGFAARPESWSEAIADSVVRARGLGAFLGSWVNTAKETFGNVYVFGTDRDRGNGERETFVVVASRDKIDLADLGKRKGDPVFMLQGRPNEPEHFGEYDMDALQIRSRGIVLTDDYAPVENLLAPVAETRAKD